MNSDDDALRASEALERLGALEGHDVSVAVEVETPSGGIAPVTVLRGRLYALRVAGESDRGADYGIAFDRVVESEEMVPFGGHDFYLASRTFIAAETNVRGEVVIDLGGCRLRIN